MAFVEAIVVLALLYFIGRSVYGKRTNRKFSLLSVLVNFFIIMVTNAVIMLLVLAVLALLIGGVGLMFGDSDEFFFVGVNERVATGQLLLLTLIVILATAILQFHLRKRLPSKVQALLHMSDEDYVICEYYEAYSWGVGEDESGDGLYWWFGSRIFHAGHPGLEDFGDQGSVDRNHSREGLSGKWCKWFHRL